MRVTIDKAGRVVIPKALRGQVGLGPAAAEIVVVGTALLVEPISTTDVAEE